MNRMILLFCLLVPLLPASAQEIQQMEFINKPIRDILLTLAGATGKSIIADSTVTGTASYYFTDTSLDKALEQFLPVNNLYFTKQDGIYHVSKIYALYNRESLLLTLRAVDVLPRLLVKSISKRIKTTILFDPLPGEVLTVQAENLPVLQVLKMIMHRFDNYEVETGADYYYIKKLPPVRSPSSRRTQGSIKEKDGLFSVDADSIHLFDALSRIFSLSGREYSLMKRGNPVLENIHFKAKPFDEILRLLLEQSEGDFTLRKGIYYIFDISRNDILKKLDTVSYIKLHTIPVEMLPALFPSGLAASSVFKIDRENNAIILSGSSEEISPVKAFIKNLETEYGEKHVVKLDLTYITADALLKALPPMLQKLKVVRTGSPYTLILEASKKRIDEFKTFARRMDSHGEYRVVHLRYIRVQDLLKHLPPSVSKYDIVPSSDSNLVFFKGPKGKLDSFLEDLQHIDIPIPQIRYELLVVQYQDGSNKDYSFSVKNEILQKGAETSILGALGNLLNINLDIVSTFGYQFALSLNAKLGDSHARILADTTLNGLTGEDISFQNTNTYRYRDMEIDPDTGKASSTGVTREITSGLLIQINGWVSGDNMITMDVKATVSKRGADVSKSSGNPPPTSEKVVTTHVRTPSGKPVVIGGLIQQETDSTTGKTPFLSSIPLLGKLFTSQTKTARNTELVIYIVPALEYPDRKKTSSRSIFNGYYQTFFPKEEP